MSQHQWLFDLMEQWKRDNIWYERAWQSVEDYEREQAAKRPRYETVTSPTTGGFRWVREQSTTGGGMK